MSKNSETETDWEKRFWEYYEGRKEKDGYINPSFLLLFIAKELADARREVISKVEKLPVIDSSGLCDLVAKDDVLATLKEETK